MLLLTQPEHRYDSCVILSVCAAVERSSAELQWLLSMAQNDPVHYVRSDITHPHLKMFETNSHSLSVCCCVSLYDERLIQC